jgi:hypothetical protein
MGIGVVVTSELITSVVYPSFTLVLYIKKKKMAHTYWLPLMVVTLRKLLEQRWGRRGIQIQRTEQGKALSKSRTHCVSWNHSAFL